MFKHLGRLEDVDLSQFTLNDAKRKGGQGATYAVGGSKRAESLSYFKANTSTSTDSGGQMSGPELYKQYAKETAAGGRAMAPPAGEPAAEK